jgi:uncharacterized protein (DUF4415 family)
LPETKDTFPAGFEWDEGKRQRNLAKHGVDFLRAARIFDGPVVEWDDSRCEYGERRRPVRMSARRTTRVSRADLDKHEDLTDWPRVHNMTDEEIAAAAATDPDTVHPDDPRWREQLEEGGVLVPPDLRKKRVSVVLDEDVIAWFRRLGRGYQHSINHVLRRHMQDQLRRKHDTAAE